MQRQQQLRSWLRQTLHGAECRLQPLAGDASFRNYSRVLATGESMVLMDAPPEQEDCRAFLRANERLCQAGVHVPQILASDVERGFLLLSDLGDNVYRDCLNERTVDHLYADALAALRRIQCEADADALPDFDAATLMEEMMLFSEWLLDKHLQLGKAAQLARRLRPEFELLVDSALGQPQVFVHRDYHSRNLMYVPGNNPGILDHQDAVRGPVSYDIVSLLKDCYLRWPPPRVRAWLHGYVRDLPGAWADIPLPQWQRWFDLMGAQRHLKASGIFARLWQRDQKPGYLADIPRTLGYITELEGDYPQLRALCTLVREEVLPRLPEALPCPR